MKTINHILPHFALTSLCGLLFAAPSFIEGANIVVNGGFENNTTFGPPWATSTMVNWTTGEVLGTGGPFQNMVDGLDTTTLYSLAPHSGNISAAFNSTTNTVTDGGVATLSQTLATVPAQTYDLSFWLANPIQVTSDFNNLFSVSWNGVLLALSSPSLLTEVGTSKTYLVTPNTAWFQVVVTGLVGTGSDVLQFSGRNSDYATLLDDVSVQASGVPDSGASIALFGIALVGLVLCQRKAQRDPMAVSCGS